MPVPFIDLSRQHHAIRADLSAAVEEVIKSNAYILGPIVKQFENHFAQRMGCKHAIGVNSGTDALLMTLHALGVQPGDEIICPTYTFVATADIIPRIGAQIVFVDINEDYTLNVEAVREAITENTRVVIPVHLYGRAAEMIELQEVCAERGIHIVEDVAQACGARLAGRALGTFGTAGCFSFYPTKNLGGFGDGGMITTDNDELAERLRIYRDHGRTAEGFVEIGYNSRLDALQAALLDVKLASMDEDNEDRIANAEFYRSRLNSEIFTLPSEAPEGAHVYNLYTIRHEQRDALRTFLDERAIATAVYYNTPLHLEPCLQYLGYVEGHFPVAEQVAREVLQLPIAPGLTRQELEEVAHTIDLFVTTLAVPTAG